MDNRRPRSREKRVMGSQKTVQKHGSGLGTGPVGGGQGRHDSGGKAPQAMGMKRNMRSAGGLKLLILLAVLVLGGGGALFNGQLGQILNPASSQSVQGSLGGVPALLSSLGGGNVSNGWLEEANTGQLHTSVAPSAREKRTKLKGGGQDTATVMVYMCGTDLESRSGMGTADLQEMLAADLGDRVNLLIYTGGCTGWRNDLVSSKTNQIWQVKDGELLCLEQDLGSVSMTDPATLTGYIQWCAQNWPASRYELIFWDHGGGSVSGYGYDQKFSSSGSMGLSGIHTALENAQVEFDFIGFDACLMATAETALMLAQHADYLIASEETEPGVGWYYTNWLTAFGADPSIPTVELGKKIADDFVDVCAQRCAGQLTTLSVVDLAELETTLPASLAKFAQTASGLISSQQYQTVANARSRAREFAQSSRIDHVDLVHLAKNLGNAEGDALAKVLLDAVKYNRTSSNMTNAYGLSIYFPYQNISTVDKAVASYQKIGMDEAYIRCIQQFASLEASGQAVSGGTASPLPALLGMLDADNGGAEAIAQLLDSFLKGGFDRIAGLDSSNAGFLDSEVLGQKEMAQYLTENRFAPEALKWSIGTDGVPVLYLEEKQWQLVQALELNVFYDDGEGYVDMGLDNVFDYNDNGGLLGTYDSTWLAIDGQPVAYYHTVTVDDGETYTITGRVPVLHNKQRAELLLTFDSEHPYGYVAGIRPVYVQGETETVAKSNSSLQIGDTLEFLCDYYSYNGEYLDSYRLGEPITITEKQLVISNVPLKGDVRATYRFTDLYHQHHWTTPIP